MIKTNSFSNQRSILKENSNRLKKIHRPYDPIYGDPEDKDRFLFNIRGLKKVYLPVIMKTIPVINNLMKCKSLASFIRTPYFKQKFNSIASLFKFLESVRLKFDFPFWTAKLFPDYFDYKPVASLLKVFQKARVNPAHFYLLIRRNQLQSIGSCMRLFVIWYKFYSKINLNVLFVSKSLTDAAKNKGHFLKIDEECSSAPDLFNFSKSCISNSLYCVSLKSKFWFMNASSPEKCRGLDYSFLFFENMGEWFDPSNCFSRKIISASFPVLANSGEDVIIMESGPSKRNSTFNKLLSAAKQNITPFRYIYIPWYDDPSNCYKLDSKEEKIKLFKWIIKYKDRNKFYHYHNVSGKYVYSLWEKGISLEAIHWYIGESTFYKSKRQFFENYPPV